MGNRAVIKFAGEKTGIYLHWNGDRASVELFLEYCKLRGFRCDDYGVARFAQVVGNFIGGELSIGVISTTGKLDSLNPGDNGIYIVKDWKIIRMYPKWIEKEIHYDRAESLKAINDCQPIADQIDNDFFAAKEVPTESLKVGDVVYWKHWDGKYHKDKIIGIGDDRWVNGQRVKDIPYIGKYDDDDEPEKNINNYLTEKSYCLAKAE